jgi:uncharacterized membrane protein YqgA involved in biofilm formation
MGKDEILEELKMLEMILEFHSGEVIGDPVEYENHINDILDRISELKEMLKE